MGQYNFFTKSFLVLCIYTTFQPLHAEEIFEPSYTHQLFEAIADGNTPLIRQLLETTSVDINEPHGPINDTPLIFAIRKLSELAFNFKQKIFTDQFTMQVALNNRLSLIRLLIFNPHIDCGKENDRGETALTLATQQEELSPVVTMLLNKTHLYEVQGEDRDAHNYRSQLAQLTLPETTHEKINDLIDKFAQSANSYDKATIQSQLDLIFQLPWNSSTNDSDDLNAVQTALDQEHYGMKKIKDRIIEFVATRIMQRQDKQHTHAPLILCLVGPPGVGKTTIAKAIAHGLGKKFEKISCGGINDEFAIRGSKKVYIGADAGRIIKALKNSKTNDPVILLDEIDKMGSSVHNGDPAAALLEALDPKQNSEFVDSFIEVPFDLSKVLFITTANFWSDIPYTLRDRLEPIFMSGYTAQEKLEIAKQCIAPQVIKNMGLSDTRFQFSDQIITHLIEEYTYEAGVRNLENRLKVLAGKAARIYLETGAVPHFTPENIITYLGAGYQSNVVEKAFLSTNNIGISNGLYWSPFGGSVAVIETTLVPGNKGIKITGQLGDVMRESAHIAVSYLKAHAKEIGIDITPLETNEIHIHAPAGSTPKDGPSAGIALVSALTSLLTKKPFNKNFAMTGEISLTGRVLPIGGLKEKILGAQRMGIKNIIVPASNMDDLLECKELIADMNIIPVTNIQQVLDHVLLSPTKEITSHKEGAHRHDHADKKEKKKPSKKNSSK